LLLSPIGTRTLATQVWIDTSTLAFAAAAPYAALLVGISLAASGALFALLGRSAVESRVDSAVAPSMKSTDIELQAGTPSESTTL